MTLNGIRAVVLAALIGVCGGVGEATAAQSYRGTPADFAEIQQLFAEYNFSIDNGDGMGWSQTFTRDGVFRDPSWCAIGRDALVKVVGTDARVGKDLKHFHLPVLGPIRFQNRNLATVHSTVMVVAEKGAGHPEGGISVTGTYDDTLVRRNGRWLFAYRYVQRPSATPPIPCAKEPPHVATISR